MNVVNESFAHGRLQQTRLKAAACGRAPLFSLIAFLLLRLRLPPSTEDGHECRSAEGSSDAAGMLV